MSIDISKNSLSPLKLYIHALIENLDKEKLPQNIDLIIDSGGFNGNFQLGILLYLKELEALNLVNIDRISGCSSGALLGVLYLTSTMDKNISELCFEKISKSFRETLSLTEMKPIIIDTINTYVTDIESLNDKLYITYYDISNTKQVVVSKFNSKEELSEIIIRSSYIPYLSGDSLQYKNQYMDGITPYIFKKSEKKTLFISSITCKKLKNIIVIKNEKNIWPKLLSGIVNINNFFTSSYTTGYIYNFFFESDQYMCSYINNWKICDFTFFKLREVVVLTIIYLIKAYIDISKHFPDYIKSNKYKTILHNISISLYNNIFSYVIV